MKRFNKILAVVLVISILASFMAVSAVAVDSPEAAFRFAYRDTSGKRITSVKSGEVVDLIVSIKTNGYSPNFAIVFCYDYTLLTHIRQNGSAVQSLTANNCRALLGDFADKATQIEDEDDPIWQFENDEVGNGYYKLWGAGSQLTATPHKDTMYPSSWGDTEKAQFKCITFGYMTDVNDSVLTVNTNNEFYEMVRFRFLALKDGELNENTVFANPDAKKTYVDIDPDDVPISAAQVSEPVRATISYAYEEAVVESPVYWVKNQIQWNNKEAKSVNIGVVAGFDVEKIAIDFGDDHIADNVSAIGAKYYLNGVLQDDLTTTRVYKANGGKSYYFRIVLGNISTTTTDTYKIVPYVVYDGTPVDGPEVEIKPADVARYVTVLPQ